MASVCGEDISVLLTNAFKNGLKTKDIEYAVDLQSRQWQLKNEFPPTRYFRFFVLVSLITVLLGVQLPKHARNEPLDYIKSFMLTHIYNPQADCIVVNGETTIEITRKPVDCNICKNMEQVPMFYNMTKDYFLKHHAYSGIPVLIKGGAKDWSALQTFGFKYFRKIYTEEALDDFEENQCQFFAYKTNLQTLRDVFKMSKKRQALKKDQWYIGWSNCVDKTQAQLREHYHRPSFLPDDSESSKLDWLFMGGSGTGAMMHIDGVNRPSWQAMIKGMKTWYIEPPPECLTVCPRVRMNATMEQGDILVIDTNKWFHSTFIHPVGLSITIGSEYD